MNEGLQTTLFVGGPAHGQLLAIPAGATLWEIPILLLPNVRTYPEADPSGFVRTKTARYEACTFGGRGQAASIDGIVPMIFTRVDQ